MSKLKEYRLFYFKVLELLIQDSELFHDVYSDLSLHFSPKMYDQYMKAMKKAGLVELSKKAFSPGTHFPKIRITKQGIEEFSHLDLKSMEGLIESHELENAFENTEKTLKKIHFFLKFIPSFLHNTKSAVIAIITFVLTLGSMMAPSEYSADLMKTLERIMQVEKQLEELQKDDVEQENLRPSAQEDLDIPEVLIPEKNSEEDREKDTENEILPEKIQLPPLKLATAELPSGLEAVSVHLSIDKKILTLEKRDAYLRADLAYSASVKPAKKFRVLCGTGETNSAPIGSCSYSREGIYTVGLRVYNDQGESQIVKEIKIRVKK